MTGLEGSVKLSSMLEGFVHQKTILLTTYRRNGDSVATPVNIAVERDRAFIRTYDKSGKAKRIRNNTIVQIAPCTFRGKTTGAPIRLKGRLLDDNEAALASRLINRKYRILQGLVVPLLHWLQRTKTLHYELTLIE
jgi:PPOX class probable F420-dependent enzyme